MEPTPPQHSFLQHLQDFGMWVVAPIAAAFAGYFKITRAAANDVKNKDADHAASDVINLLREELARLSEQNSRLAEAVNNLQTEVLELRAENVTLKLAIKGLSHGQQNY